MRFGLKYSTPEINLFTAVGRHKTFPEDWKLTCVLSPCEMSAAGLFKCPLEVINTEHKDSVMCPYCDICIAKWIAGDTALGEHRRLSSRCPFISRFPKGTTNPAERNLIFTRPNNCC
jgi:hypothetical protein